tara:strand:+ start:1382 stop:1714 length:333 start_codon:yes stop_codon:yes gene_type:complete
MITDPVLRAEQVKALKAFYRDAKVKYKAWVAGGYKQPAPACLPFPDICIGMKCEARTRSGAPCKNNGTDWGNGRCKHHGGASTGPVTPEGKKRVSMNGPSNKVLEALTKP